MKLFERTNRTSSLDTPPHEKRGVSPLIGFAAVLSAGSLVWTAWNLLELFKVGAWGITAAVCADVIWGAVIFAEYRHVRLRWTWAVPALGWFLVAVVSVFLVWHGIQTDNAVLAAGGPLLPVGAKIVWALTLADMRDPSALTDEEVKRFADMDRAEKVADKEHESDVAAIRREGEKALERTRAQFAVIRARQEFENELAVAAPIRIPSERVADDRSLSGHVADELATPVTAPANPQVTALAADRPLAAELAAGRRSSADDRPVSGHVAADRSDLDRLAEALTANPAMTGQQAATLLGVSERTGRRKLTEVKAAKGGGGYL